MIVEVQGRIDYAESGDGHRVVFVPGSCSTGAAWRPVVAALGPGHRCATTSLLGYGGTEERRPPDDPPIDTEAEIVEAVLRRAGCPPFPVHLVGHSFGGLVSLAVALRGRVPLASLTICEAPAMEILRASGEDAAYGDFRAMTETYFARFRAGEADAIATMIDFYGGQGTFASWPPKVRGYASETTPVNILDWATAFGFALTPAMLAALRVPTLVIYGGDSHHAARRANALVAQSIPGATAIQIPGATHFMIATHPGEVASAIRRHVATASRA
jgi:pimeloyl-ACP methyl ester carboxylesterase